MTRASDTIEHLRLEARRLWNDEYVPPDARREGFLAELVDVEIELERLALRTENTLELPVSELEECTVRLDRLRSASAVAAA